MSKKDNSYFELPFGWKRIFLKDACNLITGTTPSKSNQTFYDGLIPFYKPTDLEQGVFTVTSRDHLSIEGLKAGRFVPKNSVLVTCIGATIGKTGLTQVDGSCNQQINAILPNEELNSKFVYYQVISSSFQEQIKSNASSTTLPILNKSKFGQLYFIIAPIAKQQRIVAKIEELFSELDNGIANLQKAKGQLKVYRQSVLKWAFEGKLTNKDVKDGMLPDGWNRIYLKEVCDSVTNAKASENNSNEIFKYIDIGGIDNQKNKIVSHKEYFWKNAPSRAKQIIRVNDILFSTVRTYLKNIAYVERYEYNNQIGSTGFTVIRPNKEKVSPKFIFYYVLSDSFINPLNDLQTGSSYPAVRDKDVFSQNVPIPFSKAEQNEIVQEIESRLSVTDKLEETIDQCLIQSEALRQSILKRAFEGKLVPQDPNDEGAEVLVERIKQEK